MKIRRNKSDIIFDAFIYTTLTLLAIIMIFPFLQVITTSLSSSEAINSYGLKLFPKEIDLSGYKKVFRHDLIWTSYGNTLIRTVLGTGLAVILTLLGAYPLSKKYFPNKVFWTGVIVFTMYFNGGLIPNYLLVKNLGLRDTIFALILPGAVSAYNLVITRNFLSSIPESVEESARIDGANDIYIFWKIVLPLSAPIIATISMWYAVTHWNAWFDCMIYMDTQKKFVLQLILRQVILEGQVQDFVNDPGLTAVDSEATKMATLVVATIPIVCVYPFLQKYFVKGVMVGSLKG